MNAIVFSLWGDDKRYVNGALDNIALAKDHYPHDWGCVFYVPKGYRHGPILSAAGAQVIEMLVHPEVRGWEALFWRLFVCCPQLQRLYPKWVIRDADSRISAREWAAVEEWLGSDKLFHTMHDHPNHTPPIMGGMWGGKTRVPEIEMSLAMWGQRDKYFDDQRFLAEKVWPAIAEDTLIHTRDNWPAHEPIGEGEFVGARHNERGELEGNG